MALVECDRGPWKSSRPAAEGPGGNACRSWRRVALAAILIFSAVFYTWNITTGSFSYTYYSAAVKSMSRGFGNFLFGSFDPVGVVTVDKPPMSLWPQVISTGIFGFHGWALLLPQAVEGVVTVFLLHRAVRRWAGETAALLAALILAVSPITVVLNRDNTTDTLMILWLVAAAYAVTRAWQSERGQTWWLVAGGVFLGFGFLSKMLQAWIVVPAFLLAHLAGSTASRQRRSVQALAAGAAMVASSMWWVAAVDLSPGAPFVGGSTDGSARRLVVGFNGLSRLGLAASGGVPGGRAAGIALGGEPGLSRMFNDRVGGQVSWLLPLSALVLAVAVIAGVRRRRASPPRQASTVAGWILWGGWLVSGVLVFDFTMENFHPYYTAMLTPAIAAVCSRGLVVLWRWYREAAGLRRMLLPVAIALTAVWAAVLAARTPSWHGWVRYVVVGLAAVSVAGLLAGTRSRPLAFPAGLLGLVTVLLAPTVWSVGSAFAAARPWATSPTAGPPSAFQSEPLSGGVRYGGEYTLSPEQRRILDYATANSSHLKITLAVDGAANAATYLVNSDANVIGMGGFFRVDPVPSIPELNALTRQGELRFVLLPDTTSSTGGGAPLDRSQSRGSRAEWVRGNCVPVPPSTYGGSGGSETLYDCLPRH